MLQLKQFRTHIKGLADLLPYAALIEDNIILNKDGSFLASYEISGVDAESSSVDEMTYLSNRLNAALKTLSSGFMVNVDSVRVQAKAYPNEEASFFPDILTRLLDNERRKTFSSGNFYKTINFLTITYKPSNLDNKLKKITSDVVQDDFSINLEFFKKTLIIIEDTLSLSLSMFRLGSIVVNNEIRSVLLSFIQLVIFREEILPVLTDTPMYLDFMLGIKDLVAGYELKLDSSFIGVIAIDNFPSHSYPQMLSSLSSLDFEARFSTRYIALDQYEAIKEIDKYRKNWSSQIFGFLDKILNKVNPRPDMDALSMSEDAELVYTELQGNYVSAGYYSANIVISSQNKEDLEEKIRFIRRILADLGFSSRLEEMNALDAWLSTHPGNSYANIRRPIITTLNLADLLPISTIYTGSEYTPCPFYTKASPALAQVSTNNSTVFWFNYHYGDVAHSLVMGPTGAGKSTFLCATISQFFRYEKAKIFFFDKGKSIYTLCKGANGKHYNIGGEDISFCPLKNIDQASERAWANDYIETLCKLQKLDVAPAHKNAIHNALTQLAEQAADMRTLTNFMQSVQNTDVKQAIRHYTISGAMGTLLDAEADNIDSSNFIVFEIEELMNMGEQNTIPVLLYLFHLIETNLKGQPTLLVLDEAWIMLSKPWIAAKIKEMLKVMRKANCGVILSTQSISDVSSSGIIDVINESCFTKVYLANEKALEPISKSTYEALGCTQRDIEIIASAIPKREYYVKNPEGARLINLALTRTELTFYGVSSKEDLAKVDEFISLYHDNWIEYWINYKLGEVKNV